VNTQVLKGVRILIIIPGTVSYFYDEEGRRVAEALRNLGGCVDVETLRSYTPQPYDWCFLMNLSEIEFSMQSKAKTLQHVRHIKSFATRVAMILLESVEMKWFFQSLQLLQEADIDILLDLGFHNQYERATPETRKVYHFIFNGLTKSEREAAYQMFTPLEERPLPWTFVGHLTKERMRFLNKLTENLSRDGFLYLVHFTPVTETGPHLNQEQFFTVLTRTQYKIWCSHHPFFYIESIRFRMALLAGTVPMKVNLDPHRAFDQSLPFSYLIHHEDDFHDAINQLDFEETRQKFATEFLEYPSLEASLLDGLNRLG